jgi:hypothetical protein
VTFAPTGAEAIPKDLEQRVTLGGTRYTLYTHSFLGLGQEAAQEALGSAVLHGSSSEVRGASPLARLRLMPFRRVSDGRLRIVTLGILGCELTRPFRDARRLPSTRL